MKSGFQLVQLTLLPAVDVSGLCRKPYPLHPKGCPNWNKKLGCPPTCRRVDHVLDLSQPIYAIYNAFDFATHTAKMRAKHPDWSQRQVECCLYWQGTARKTLRSLFIEFRKAHPGLHVMMTPEGSGVDITATMASIGINLEWPPVNVAYQVAIAGTAREYPDVTS